MKIEERLSQLGITLTPPPPAAGAFVPWAQVGNLLFLSGHIARRDGGKPWPGRLGDTMATEEGKVAARAVAVDLLGTLQAALGDLSRIRRIAKLLVLVHSADTFTEHHLVANGASELLKEVLGEAGAHARSAFGVAQLPFGVCVEIELIAEIAPD